MNLMVRLRDARVCQPVKYRVGLFGSFFTGRFQPSAPFLAVPVSPSHAHAYQVARISTQGILCPTVCISNFENWKVDVDFIVHLEKAVGDELVRDLYPNIDEIDGKIKCKNSPYAMDVEQASRQSLLDRHLSLYRATLYTTQPSHCTVYGVGQRDAFFACSCKDLCFVKAFGREPLPDYYR